MTNLSNFFSVDDQDDNLFKSDHEFSCESDVPDEEAAPVKHARTGATKKSSKKRTKKLKKAETSIEEEVSMSLNFFLLSLMMRPNKLERLSLETLSSQVLEFEGKARANPIEAPFRCFLIG
jgi:hypothetical protein